MCLIGLLVSALGGVAAWLLRRNETVLLASRFAGRRRRKWSPGGPRRLRRLSAACAPLDRRFAPRIWSGYLPAGVGLAALRPWSPAGAGAALVS
ncbi:MAG: hypothetical protein M5R42_01600 [Rhodocyclaceae bacterium]|nr:hypothetical protein [Rhodocyclaceae bacterium]